MRQTARTTAAHPFAFGALGAGASAIDAFGGPAVRAWFAATANVQAETAAFWTGRVGKDLAALTALAQCTAPDAFAALQLQYARDAWTDFERAGQRLTRIVSEAGAFTLPPLPGSVTNDA